MRKFEVGEKVESDHMSVTVEMYEPDKDFGRGKEKVWIWK